jgi:hypothetical protein
MNLEDNQQTEYPFHSGSSHYAGFSDPTVRPYSEMTIPCKKIVTFSQNRLWGENFVRHFSLSYAVTAQIASCCAAVALAVAQRSQTVIVKGDEQKPYKFTIPKLGYSEEPNQSY